MKSQSLGPLATALLLLGLLDSTFAQTRTSADYTIQPDTLDSAGGPGGTTDYQLLGSLGSIGSVINGTAPTDTTLWNGYIGQLLDVAPPPAPVPSGLVAWWRAENNAYDVTGNHSGTLVGENGFSAGQVGQAFNFDGTHAHVFVAASAALALQNLTIEGWIKTPGIAESSVEGFIVARSGTDGLSGFELTVRGSPAFAGRLRFILNGGDEFPSGADVTSTAVVTDNAFHHVAATYDGATLRIYVDGQLDVAEAHVLTVNYSAASRLIIGRRDYPQIPGFFNGLVDELSLYGRALSAAEVQTIYDAGSAGKSSDNAPIIITESVLPSGQMNTPYSQTLVAALGTPPYTFAAVGPMPGGMTLSSGGVVGGTPTVYGTVTFTAQVTDAASKSSTKLFSIYLLGTTYVWNAGGGDWSAAGNWNPVGVPGADDVAIVNNGGTVTVSDTRSVARFDMANSSKLEGGGTLTVNSVMNWTQQANMSGSGRTVIALGGILNVDAGSDLRINARMLENAGRVSWTGDSGGRIILDNGAVITNWPGGTFEARGNANIVFENGPGTGHRFDNAGNFIKMLGTGSTTISVPFNNYGTVEVQTGTLHCGSVFNSPGTVTLSAGATNRLAGGGSASGPFNTVSGALVDFTGNYTLNNGAQLNGAGLYRINGATLTFNTDLGVQNLDFNGGTWQGGGTVTNTGVMNWTGQTYMSGAGRTVIAAGAILNVDAGADKRMNAHTLENAGRVSWTGDSGGRIILDNGAVITNWPGGTFEARGNANIVFENGPGTGHRFDNAGNFIKMLGTGSTTISVPFNNYGTVAVQSGTLHCGSVFNSPGTVTLSAGATNRLAGGGSASGPFNTVSGALVDFTGNYTLNNGAQLNGAGLYRINGATLTFNTDLGVQNLDFNGGTWQGGGTVTNTGVMNWTGQTYMSGAGRTVIAAGAILNVDAGADKRMNAHTLENAGRVSWTGDSGGRIILDNGAVITNWPVGTFEARGNANIVFENGPGTGHRFDNAGTFVKMIGTLSTTLGVPFNNYGTVEVVTGTLNLSGAYNQYAGLLALCSGNIANSSPLQILAGEVRGSGNISGDVNNVGGTVSPGCSPGQLTIGGNYTQGANGTLNIELAGTTQGVTYDKLAVAGTATLAGTLRATLANGFYPAANAAFSVLTFASRSGVFTSFSSPLNDVGMELIYSGNAITVHVINVRPNVPVIGTQTFDEMVAFSLPVGATDGDLPAQTLSYALSNAPSGMTITSGGVINWTPGESQGPGTNNLTVLVRDNGTPNLTNSHTFEVVVNEVNVAPVVDAFNNYAVNPGQIVSFTATATDSDVPANILAFSLLSPPAGATITSGGLFNWRPGVALRDTTNTVRVRVTDNGAPNKSGTNSFTVIINPIALVTLTPVSYAGGQFTFSVTGPLGPDYVIMASTNLVDWTNLHTNTPASVPFNYTDTNAGAFGYRFYRALLDP